LLVTTFNVSFSRQFASDQPNSPSWTIGQSSVGEFQLESKSEELQLESASTSGMDLSQFVVIKKSENEIN
jgi:hypothetical protein